MADKGATWHDDKAKPLLAIWQAYLVIAQESFKSSCIDNTAEMNRTNK